MTTPRPVPALRQLVVPCGAVVAPLHPPRDNTRYRAIAAVSGIAAAALVVAGVASGGGPSRRPTVSAQSQSVRTGSRPGVEAPGASPPAFPVAGPAEPVATTVAEGGGSSGLLASTSTPTVPTGSRPAVVVGATVTKVAPSVTSTASEVGSVVPAVAPLTGAAGAAGTPLSGVGQMLTSTAT